MKESATHLDPLIAACDAVLREVAAYPITPERLHSAGPLIVEIVSAIREMDEVDVSGVEPLTVFRLLP